MATPNSNLEGQSAYTDITKESTPQKQAVGQKSLRRYAEWFSVKGSQ